jgi:hypothetical protein
VFSRQPHADRRKPMPRAIPGFPIVCGPPGDATPARFVLRAPARFVACEHASSRALQAFEYLLEQAFGNAASTRHAPNLDVAAHRSGVAPTTMALDFYLGRPTDVVACRKPGAGANGLNSAGKPRRFDSALYGLRDAAGGDALVLE